MEYDILLVNHATKKEQDASRESTLKVDTETLSRKRKKKSMNRRTSKINKTVKESGMIRILKRRTHE